MRGGTLSYGEPQTGLTPMPIEDWGLREIGRPSSQKDPMRSDCERYKRKIQRRFPRGHLEARRSSPPALPQQKLDNVCDLSESVTDTLTGRLYYHLLDYPLAAVEVTSQFQLGLFHSRLRFQRRQRRLKDSNKVVQRLRLGTAGMSTAVPHHQWLRSSGSQFGDSR